MIEVEIENFQSIEAVKFKIAGFTALVGRSNVGKSAIVRAIRCALVGEEGGDFVRHHAGTCSRILRSKKTCQCKSTVRLDFGGGKVVLWEKGDNINRYTVQDGGTNEVYDRIGRNPELPPLLRDSFAQDKLGDSRHLLQVADQHNPLFLLNLGGTTAADVLSDVAKLDEINVALRLVAKDVKETQSTRKVRDGDVKHLQESVAAYAGIETVAVRSKRLSSGFEALRTKTALVKRLEQLRQNLFQVGTRAAALLKATKPTVPDARRLRDNSGTYVQLAAYEVDWGFRKSSVQGLLWVPKISLPENTLNRPYDRYRRVAPYDTGWDFRNQAVEELVWVSQISVPENALRARYVRYSQLRQWELRHRVLAKASERDLPELKFSHPVAVFRKKQDELGDLKVYTTRMAHLTQAVKQMTSDFEAAVEDEAQVRKAFEELGVCVTCSQAISPDHVLCKG